ncbi:glycosyltransferase [Methylotetracoccus oryzae]|uniref:glycosyltransferase n=1 Tax=Methylotetracoccus oryzae TaxID=1919059 RepID=UPI00111B04F6|nr:glycosyltransferase [Methylotetracoccus oryzae]
MRALIPWRWTAERWLTDRLGYQRRFSSSPLHRVLLISAPNELCHTQLYPFLFHRKALRQAPGIELRELPLAAFRAGGHVFARQRVDVVCVQTWFDLSDDELRQLLEQVRTAFPEARIAYFDWFAPTDLRYAQAVDDSVAVYLKKQVFRDRGAYSQSTRGDTNLTDYFSCRYGLDLPETRFSIPAGFFRKLVLGPNFCFSAHMLPYFLGDFPESPKAFDVHARIAVKGTEWYTRMRQEALDVVEGISGVRLVSRGRVPRSEYFKELFASKICFSPFGYGEVCWRDYEAAFAGALLIKPNMDHIESRPDIFQAHRTYVPVQWDLSDLEETVRYYLDHADERIEIARCAFDTVKAYLEQNAFLDDMKPFWERLLPGDTDAGGQSLPRS